MPIITHPTIKINVPGLPYHDSAYVVKCDNCSSFCSRVGKEPGDAAEEARKKGWITRKAVGHQIGDPKVWACAGCLKTEQKKKPE